MERPGHVKTTSANQMVWAWGLTGFEICYPRAALEDDTGSFVTQDTIAFHLKGPYAT
jgi:hypothetical protein